MRRREFIAGLGAAAWPVVARAQQPDRMRRIGVLMALPKDDPGGAMRLAQFAQALQQLGWTIGRNVRIEYRWGVDSDEARGQAAELAGFAPDVILASGSEAVAASVKSTPTTPLVFTGVVDPVGAGFVESLARPGGAITGFTMYEYGISGKWLELLRKIAPRVTRVAVMRDAGIAAGSGQLGAIQAVAPQMGLELRPLGVRDAPEIERGIAAFARDSDGGLIVTGSFLAAKHRKLIISLAARHKLPTVYNNRAYVDDGGLISYGTAIEDQFRLAAGYVDRILRGEKPGDLPVQAPTKFELVINLRTAKALGLTVPETLLGTADEVIQ
jgi:putative ABC transport system substrate-binding protein